MPKCFEFQIMPYWSCFLSASITPDLKASVNYCKPNYIHQMQAKSQGTVHVWVYVSRQPVTTDCLFKPVTCRDFKEAQSTMKRTYRAFRTKLWRTIPYRIWQWRNISYIRVEEAIIKDSYCSDELAKWSQPELSWLLKRGSWVKKIICKAKEIIINK